MFDHMLHIFNISWSRYCLPAAPSFAPALSTSPISSHPFHSPSFALAIGITSVKLTVFHEAGWLFLLEGIKHP